MATNNALNVGLSGSTGSGSFVGNNSPIFTTIANLGTVSAGNLINCTGLPISTGVSGLGTGIATFLGTPSSANLSSALTTKAGTGNAVFETDSTLTPVLNFGGATTGITYGAQTGVYSQVGNTIIFNLAITLTSVGSATGAATITGLPVAARASTNSVFLLVSDRITFTGNFLVAKLAAGATSIALFQCTTALASSALANTNFVSNTVINISGSYLI